MAYPLLKAVDMKRTGSKPNRTSAPTLADLVATVTKLTRNERLTAYIVADMINSRRVCLEGQFHGHRVQVG